MLLDWLGVGSPKHPCHASLGYTRRHHAEVGDQLLGLQATQRTIPKRAYASLASQVPKLLACLQGSNTRKQQHTLFEPRLLPPSPRSKIFSGLALPSLPSSRIHLASGRNPSTTSTSRKQLDLRGPSPRQTRQRLSTTLIPLRQLLFSDSIRTVARIQTLDKGRTAHVTASDIESPGHQRTVLVCIELHFDIGCDAFPVGLRLC